MLLRALLQKVHKICIWNVPFLRNYEAVLLRSVIIPVHMQSISVFKTRFLAFLKYMFSSKSKYRMRTPNSYIIRNVYINIIAIWTRKAHNTT